MTDREQADILDRLMRTLAEKRTADPAHSYTASLIGGGPERVGKKIGEEATETVIALCQGDRDALARESADLIYHLMVAWTAAGLEPAAVWRELARREGVSGHDEKASRGHGRQDDAGGDAGPAQTAKGSE